MPLSKLQFRPGINNDLTSYSNEGGWRDGDKIRFRLGYPEKMGGWEKYTSSTYLGTARALHNWIALDGSDYLGVGTHLKYYIEEGGGFSDITPIRSTSSQGDVTFAATNGSDTLTVNHTNHGANQNDYVTFTSAETLGGNVTAAILNAEHQVARVINSSSYEITLPVTANSSDTGVGGAGVGTVTLAGTGVGGTGAKTVTVGTSGTGVGALTFSSPSSDGVGNVTISGASTGSATTTGVVQTSSTGNGTGATFSVTASSGDYTVSVTAVGSGYVVGEEILIEGQNLGGTKGTHDLTLTITHLAGSSVGDTTHTGVTQTSTSGSGTGAQFSVTTDGNGGYSLSVTTVGSGYVANDTITIAGTSVGGATPANDIVLTVTQLSGSSLGTATFTEVAQTSTSGSGSGAKFTITTDGAGAYAVDEITTIGSGYATSDTITIAGTSVGGATPANDLVLTITALTSVSFTGVTQASTSGSGSGAAFTITANGSNVYSVDAITAIGTGYAASDTITIAGTSLGGATTANDLTLTISALSYPTIADYQINVGLNTTVGGTGFGAGPFGGVAGHTPASSTLNGATTTTAGTITLASTTGFPTSGYAVILVAAPGVSEVIQYTGISGNDLTGCTRGLFSTPAAAHSSGATLQEATYGWGMPSSLTTTTQIRLWSHDNFGEDLLINPRDEAIYYWDKINGTGSRAVEISTLDGTKTSVPTKCKQVMVSDRDRHVLAFGCDAINNDPAATTGDGIQDPLLIRFSSQENQLVWYPAATNTAGDLRLGSGSTFVRAIETKREILVWTDTALSSMRFIGPPFTFGLQQLANNITIAGPNAVAATEDFVFWMGIDNFYVYAGQTTQLPCTVKDHVFQDIDLEQLDKVYAGVNSEYGEAMWLYPSSGATENDRYVIYNYLDKIWYYGTLARTSWLDRGTRNFPLATEGGYLYNHEFGHDDDGSAMTSYIESAAMDIQDGDHFLYIRRIVPDLTFAGSTALSTPQATFTIKARNFPGEDFNNTGSGTATRTQVTPVEEYTNQVHARIRGRSFAFRVESTALGSKWKLGSPRVDIRPDGRR